MKFGFGPYAEAMLNGLRKLFGGPRESVVQVAFRALDRDLGNHNPEGYAYEWALDVPPEIGMRVIVPGMDGQSPAIVTGLGRPEGAKGIMLKRVTRVATADEIAAAQAQSAADLAAWLDMARRAAGLPTPGRARRKAPADYPEIPPADGAGTADEADDWGRVWWRIMKRAEKQGRDAEEVKRYQAIAHRWFAVRDREAK